MTAAPSVSRLGHLPGLDGLRAIAVIAVFLFHAGVIDGGFIGVDVFFVVSGFLITALAIAEVESNGRLDLAAFWARRARRLLPAVFVLCAAVVVASAVLGGGAARRVGRDVVAAITYVANWTRVGEGHDYFAAYESPSLLEHTWSLAVEEQFYVVWPLVIVALVKVFGAGRARRSIGVVATVVAIGSVASAAVLAHRGVGLNRLYYGTDTRAVGLALGAVAACMLARGSRTGARRIGRAESIAAVGGALFLTAAAVTIDGGERWLYGPGFLAIAVASLLVVTAASGDGPVGRVLGVTPLVAVGRVSYGVYLWHWPVIVLLDEGRTGLNGPRLGLLWVSTTAVLTIGSWFLVEQRSRPPAMAHPLRTAAYLTAAVTVAVGANATVSAERAGRGEIAIPDAPPAAAQTAMTPASVDASSTPRRTAPATSVQVVTAPIVTAPIVTAPAQPPVGRSTAIEDRRTGRSAAEGDADAGAADAGADDDIFVDRFEPAAVTGVVPDAEAVVTPVVPSDRPLRVLVIGDSVAASLDPIPDGPLQVAGFGPVDVRNEGIVACPVLRLGSWKFSGRTIGDPDECSGDDRFAPWVDEFRPDVLFVLFGWPGRGEGRHFDDGTVISPCEPAFDVPWADEMELIAHRFADVTSVVVANVAPPGLEFTADSTGAACLNAELATRDVVIFDFAEWICPAGDCAPFDALRPDAVHFGAADDIRLPVLGALVRNSLITAGFAPTN